MALRRRAFLQQTGMALTAMGLSEAGLSLLTDRYQQALAQPARRKLALLVGINQYPEAVCDYVPVKGSALNGSITDVELQQELLIHRFGFQPSNILTLTDQTATRQGIEAAFISHLVHQATAGDLVLFHFSGLGSQIQREEAQPQIQNSLVPIDGLLPTVDNPVISDLLEETLGLLLCLLPTEQVITVLDTSYTSLGRTFQGNLRIRSRPNAPTGSINLAEQAFQEQLLQQTRLSREQINYQWRSGQLPGVVLQASGSNRVATEAQWNGFSAGLFTYAMTQQLWWSTPATTLWTSFAQAAGAVKQAAGIEQQPNMSGARAQKQSLQTSINTVEQTGADGVIQSIEEDGKVRLWLAGLPAIVLEHAGASLFSMADPVSTESKEFNQLLRLRTRDGLTVRARGLTSDGTTFQAGQLIQEAVRILPRNLGLTVALDTSLERIERVDATSAFAAIPRVSSVIAGEQSADFLFGKTQPAQILAASLPTQSLLVSESIQDVPQKLEEIPSGSTKSSYGLFYPGRNAIPNTLIQDGEAVKTAINRMTPQLKTLLAIKLLRLTQNQGSSRLGVRAALEVVAPQERLLFQQQTVRAPRSLPITKVTNLLNTKASPTLPVNSQIQYRLQNYGDRPVYFMLIGLDPKGNAVVSSGSRPSLPAAAASQKNLIEPGETVIVPPMNAANWLIQNPIGLAETYLIFSRAPFTEASQVLETELRSKSDDRPVTTLLNSLEVVQAVLQDLHQASSSMLSKLEIPPDVYALDVNTWATLSFIYQVVEGSSIEG